MTERRRSGMNGRRILWIVAEDWFFGLHYLPLAEALVAAGAEVHLAARFGRRGAGHATAIAAAGIRVHPLAKLDRTGLDPRADLGAVDELTALCRRLAPDLVQTVAMKPVIYGTIAARRAGVAARCAWLPGLGHVFTARGIKTWLLRQVVTGLLRWALGDGVTRAMVLNADDQQMVARLIGVPSNRVVVMPGTGVDLDRFTVSEEPAGPIVAAFTGRMLGEKGLVDLVEAARRMRARGIDLTVRLVGAPDPENPTAIPEATLNGWTREGAVTWQGATEDIPAVWRGAHVAVLPSHREGLSMSLLEAAACGRPAVTTDVPGCREAVVDGVTGLLVPPRDPAALVEALVALATDGDRRRRLGRAARRRVENHFSMEMVCERLIALYEEALAVADRASA
ncbi:MAG: glycosyltransferase family 4 protein [Alphaproteobacteria bacterium]|nr:glycosyltransferase family 4 protein [Alphaproteobacteria bacterium]